jgi:MoaA/NifB/PqqE/SkfB family radical SAM enzyme
MTTAAPHPAHVFLDVFVECNLRCVQCDIWRLRDPPGQLTLAERIEVIRQIAEWRPEIRLVLTGGELFLKREPLYAVAAACLSQGVYATMSSNGTLIRPADVERLPGSGVRCIVLSVDSDEREVHDRIRGVPGTFDRVVRSIRRLVEARDRARTDFTVLTSTILGKHNLHRVQSMVAFFESLGVDTTLFQPIQPAFARPLAQDWWADNPLFPTEDDPIDAGLEALVRLKAEGRRIFQSPRQFEDMRHYFHHPTALLPGQCASMDHSLMVDLFGDVRLCFNMERIGLRPIANIRERSLRAIWEDEAVERTRATMRRCRAGCGTMICHAR